MSARSLGGTDGCIEDDTGTRGNFLWLKGDTSNEAFCWTGISPETCQEFGLALAASCCFHGEGVLRNGTSMAGDLNF